MNLKPPSFCPRRGFLEIDLAVALTLLTLAMIPLAFAFAGEHRTLQAVYHRAAAAEIVDGEMEILAAGAGANLPDGAWEYRVHAAAATRLPPGHFELTKTGKHLRLEWIPEARRGVPAITRETNLK